ncbi:hypothetical protein K490DRAFT_30933 [Saccharata proteae CBS 121410]|uniref:BAG domain-containing protein n=1 Tax=Saccharata proteae CBS 121410 TaxID=1314787 RepID=A0A9P4M0A1_9PEZI|nr:hypothetical protein K490DRAFT_30933 [Saccharata proteae CBS 121410]
MSWSSKFGSWGGRFSPFTARGDSSNSAQVSDADFSYITAEDLKNPAAGYQNVDAPATANNGETDVVVLKNKRVSYPVHFARGAIDSGELGVAHIRAAAARKMDVDDARRIKLFYKGRQLRDEQQARAVGLRSDTEAEILCVVGESAPQAHRGGSAYGQQGWSAGSDEEDTTDQDGRDGSADRSASTKKKRNKRGGKKSRKNKGGGAGGDGSGTSTPSHGVYTTAGAGAEFLGTTGGAVPPRPSSAAPPSRPGSTAPPPQTALQKLDAISSNFHTKLVPECVQFMNHPPSDRAKKEFEHKKLTEIILAQVLLKLDAVETEGDGEARARRKELVRECNAMLGKLDEVM